MYPPYSENAEYIKAAVRAFAQTAFVNDNEYNNRIAVVSYDAEASVWNGSDTVAFKWRYDGGGCSPDREVASYRLTYENCFMTTETQVNTAMKICMREPDSVGTMEGMTNTMGGLIMADIVARTRTEETQRPLLIIMFTDGLPTCRYLTSTSSVTYDASGVRTSVWEYRRTVEAAQYLRESIDSYPNSEASIYNIALFNDPDMGHWDYKIADAWMSDEENYQWTYDTNYNSYCYTDLRDYIHNMSKYFSKVAPTADYYNCIVGSITSNYLPKLYCNLAYCARLVRPCGHAQTNTEIIEATCSETGLERVTCATCGELLSEETIALKAHAYDEGVLTKAPTCTEEGVKLYNCALCSHSYTETVQKINHSYAFEIIAPTCTEDGYVYYHCTCCTNSYTGNEVAALGHSYETVVTAPTCTENGYTTYTCTDCADSYVADEVSAPGHSYGEGRLTKEPTCTEAGEMTFTCTCGDVRTQTVAALAHNIVYCPEKAATCTEDGCAEHYLCESCREIFFDAEGNFPADRAYLQIRTTGHNYVMSTE